VRRIEQRFLTERLVQERHSSTPQRLRRNVVISMRRDENDRRAVILGANRHCNSRPPIPDVRTSRIRHAVQRNWGEFRKSSAETNPMAAKPADPIRLTMPSTTERSSSTTEIRGISVLFMFAASLSGLVQSTRQFLSLKCKRHRFNHPFHFCERWQNISIRCGCTTFHRGDENSRRTVIFNRRPPAGTGIGNVLQPFSNRFTR
jgi:hypothetical protein